MPDEVQFQPSATQVVALFDRLCADTAQEIIPTIFDDRTRFAALVACGILPEDTERSINLLIKTVELLDIALGFLPELALTNIDFFRLLQVLSLTLRTFTNRYDLQLLELHSIDRYNSKITNFRVSDTDEPTFDDYSADFTNLLQSAIQIMHVKINAIRKQSQDNDEINEDNDEKINPILESDITIEIKDSKKTSPSSATVDGAKIIPSNETASTTTALQFSISKLIRSVFNISKFPRFSIHIQLAKVFSSFNDRVPCDKQNTLRTIIFKISTGVVTTTVLEQILTFNISQISSSETIGTDGTLKYFIQIFSLLYNMNSAKLNERITTKCIDAVLQHIIESKSEEMLFMLSRYLLAPQSNRHTNNHSESHIALLTSLIEFYLPQIILQSKNASRTDRNFYRNAMSNCIDFLRMKFFPYFDELQVSPLYTIFHVCTCQHYKFSDRKIAKLNDKFHNIFLKQDKENASKILSKIYSSAFTDKHLSELSNITLEFS